MGTYLEGYLLFHVKRPSEDSGRKKDLTGWKSWQDFQPTGKHRGIILRHLLKSSAIVQCSLASLGESTSLLNQQTDSTAIKATLILVNHMLVLVNFHT